MTVQSLAVMSNAGRITMSSESLVYSPWHRLRFMDNSDIPRSTMLALSER